MQFENKCLILILLIYILMSWTSYLPILNGHLSEIKLYGNIYVSNEYLI